MWCRKLPFGLWLIGPRARSVITAALEDAAAYRSHGWLNDPASCTDCLDAPVPCRDHQLDQDAADAYTSLLDRIGVTEPELVKLRKALAKVEEGSS